MSMRMFVRASFSIGLAALLASCNIPADPEGTLDRVRGGTMRVGVTHSPPWVDLGSGDPAGVEVSLVEEFAETLNADIEWVPGSEEELFSALHERSLELVIGGITSKNPFVSEVTFTHPYFTTALVIGAPVDERLPGDIAGREVAVEEGTEAVGLLEKTDAQPRPVTDVAEVDGLVVVQNWELQPLSLEDSGIRLAEFDHVMAVPSGENAWLTHLERFLLKRPDQVETMLQESVS